MSTIRFFPHVQSLNSTYYSGIVGYTVNGNTQRSVMAHDGQVDPTHVAVLDQKPDITTRTVDVATVLAAVGFNGLALTEMTTWFQKGKDCGTRDATAVHAKAVATGGCAVMRALRAAHNQVVIAEIQSFLKSSDGLTDPLAWSYTQSLAGSVSAAAHYTLGPVYVTPSGGSRTQITVQDWELDPGIDVEPESDDGLTYPTYVGINKREPKVSINTPDIDHTNVIDMNGTIGEAELFLRKISEGGEGARVADGTAEHIKITIADGLILTDNVNAETDGKAQANMMVDCSYDGSNAIVVLEFDQAIA